MQAVLDLAVYALLFFALALAITSKKVTGAALQALAGFVGRIPYLGDALRGAIEGVASSIDHALGGVVDGIEKAIGKSWHLQARLFEWALRELRSHAKALLLIATPVGLLTAALHAVRALVHRLEHAGHAVGGTVKTLEREYHGIEHRVKELERKVARGIGHDLRIHIKALEGEVTTIETKTIPEIRSLARSAENDVSSLRKWITDNVPIIGSVTFVGAIAAALSALGLGGLRCNTLLNSLSNRGCGLWKGLEDLLGLFVDTLLLANVCELIPLLETAVSDVADPLVIALTDIGAGLCDGGIGPAPQLTVPALSLPANPGFTLNLP